MGIADGSYSLGPDSGQLLIKTSRTGLGARAGHDLTIEVTRWRAEVTVDSADVTKSSVSVEADAESFEVREGTGGVKPLTGADRVEIKKTIREKILHTRQHPEITFGSTRIAGTAESFSIDGNLTITGRTQPVTVHGRRAEDRVQGSATIVQSRWGIRPYTAFFGALKLSDEVAIEFSIGLTPPSART
jgi:polyisoprenoid-binding protein YceI